MPELEQNMEWAEQLFTQLATSNVSDWKLSKRKGDSTVYQRLCPETQWTVYRLETTIHQTTMNVMSHHLHALSPYRVPWDSNLQQLDVLEQFDDQVTMVLRHLTNGYYWGMVSPRDSICLSRFKRDEYGAACQVVLFDTDKCNLQPTDGVVRARVYPSGLRFRPNPKSADAVDLTLLVHADINMALLPSGIRDNVVPKQCITFAQDLQKSVKNKIQILPAHSLPPWA